VNDDEVCAVRRDTDLRLRARELHRAHEAVLTGHVPAAAPRRVVARSWARMRADGVDPEHRPVADPASPELLEQRRCESPLAGVLESLRTSLASVAEAAGHLMVVADADGVVLWRDGCPRVRRHADTQGFAEGALWSESSVGTNAIGTALVEDGPVQLFSAEHFVRTLQWWTCTAGPVHDPWTGELLGVVDVSGPASTAHPATVALVGTTVRLAEAELWREHERRLNSLRAVAGPLLGRLHGPAAVVDVHGWVAAVVGLPPADRVAVPEDGALCHVPGIGACVPEPVPGGWLLRGLAPDRSAPRLQIDTASSPPCAVIETADATWRHPLTRRHVEVLALLIRAGPAGLDAAALSRSLFGDETHLVTVRAEVSRIRQRLGSLVLTRPYRIAHNVRVSTEHADALLAGPDT
jgi:hypothetical protein